MTGAWRTLRVQLAVLGFVAIYVPVLVLFAVTFVTEDETVETGDVPAGARGGTGEGPGGDAVEDTRRRSPWALWTSVGLAPAAAGLAWWWAGRAVRPIDHVRSVAEDIEASDLGRRIALDRGPTEVVALAAGFDAMLDRLQAAADTQRQLIEETSHELRTPLSVLTTNADVLLAHPRPSIELYREGLERSRTAADRMRLAIEALLTDARGRAQAIDRRPADLVAIAREVLDEARVLAGARGIGLSFAGPPGAVAPVDEVTVRRAVANLVDNAIAYSPSGTGVEVRVEAGPSEVAVVVTDHGPGIPADELPHVFDRFWRGRHDTEGMGLGIPIAHQVALAHGGTLTLTSPGRSGDGTEARLGLRP